MVKINANRNAAPSIGEVIGDVVKVRGRLAMLGWPSMAAWARAHGYSRQTVTITVQKWGTRTDRKPHGGFSQAVMRDLRETFALGKGPDSVAQAGK